MRRTGVLLFLLSLLASLVSAGATADGVPDLELTGLQVTAGGQSLSLLPAFSTTVLEYAALAGNDISSITVTPQHDTALSVRVNGVLTDTDHPSVELALEPGRTATVNIQVLGPRDRSLTYTLEVTRLALSGLTLTAGETSLSLAFDPATLNYTLDLGCGVDVICVAPRVDSELLDVTVNEASIDANHTSQEISILPGVTTISVRVLGPGSSSVTYTIVVTSPVPELACQAVTVHLGPTGSYTLTDEDVRAICGDAAQGGCLTDIRVAPRVFECSRIGENPVTVTAVGPGGTEYSCVATVTVVDDLPPAINTCPPVLALETYEAAAVTLPDITWTLGIADNCTPKSQLSVVQLPAPGSTLASGETLVTVQATDSQGNQSVLCSVTVSASALAAWPMAGGGSGRTGSSPLVGIAQPWFVALYTEAQARTESGLKLEFAEDFLLVAKRGILLAHARERGVAAEYIGDYLVAVDPNGPSLLWAFPVLFGAPVVPAIGPDGTVYVFDADGVLVGLAPETGRVIWSADLWELLPEPYRTAMGKPFWRQYPGTFLSFWPPLLIGPQGHLYAYYEGHVFAFRTTPSPELVWTRPVNAWLRHAVGPDETYYARDLRDGKVVLSAVDARGSVRWETTLPGTPRETGVTSPSCFAIGADGTLFLPTWSDTGAAQVMAFGHQEGQRQWTYSLSGSLGAPVLFALGRGGVLYVVTQTSTDLEPGAVHLTALDVGTSQQVATFLWSAALGEGWADGLVVDAIGTAHVSVRHVGDPERSWNDDHALFLVRDGNITETVPMWGRMSIPPAVLGENLAIGAKGILYRVATSSRAGSVPGFRDNAILATVVDEAPKILSLTSKPLYGGAFAVPMRYRFDCAIADRYLPFRDYVVAWDFGDGHVETVDVRGEPLSPETTLTQYHNYETQGSFSVRVSLQVEGGGPPVTSEAIACVLQPQLDPPSSWPSTDAYVGETVFFLCNASFPCREDLDRWDYYEWSFGDGEKGYGNMPRHVYTRPGVYEVRLRVGKDPFAASRTLNINVIPVPDVAVRATPVCFTPGGVRYDFALSFETPVEVETAVRWQFGDGEEEPRGTTTASHEYTQPGRYVATATVTLGNDVIRQPTATAVYQLPNFRIQGTSPLRLGRPWVGAPLAVRFDCLPVDWPAAPVACLLYKWRVDDVDCPPSSPSLEWTFDTTGPHTVQCQVAEPRSPNTPLAECELTVNVEPFPFPTPDGHAVPFLRNPGIASQALCRGACGSDCPSTCEAQPDVTLHIPDPYRDVHYTVTYTGVTECGSHSGCRDHDACFDFCAEMYGETDVLGDCHMECNCACANDYDLISLSQCGLTPWGCDIIATVLSGGVDAKIVAAMFLLNPLLRSAATCFATRSLCLRWMIGLPPYDTHYLYSDPPTFREEPGRHP